MAGFLESLIGTESGGNWQAQNSVKGAGGMMGHFGRLQFGRARLQDAMNAGVIPQGVTPEQFMADPAMQQRVEAWHFSDIDRNAANMGLTKYVGQTVGGIPITPEAIRAMAHLGGIGGAAKFLETGGQHNPADAYGTSLADYARKHGGAMGGGDMRGSGGNPLVMGGAGGDTMQPEKPKGLLGFLGDEDKRARLAMALEGMTLNPNQGYMMMLSEGIKDRRTTKAADAAKNKTAAWLRSQGREDLAAAIESGVMNGTDAAKMAMEKPDPLAQINLELKQLELQQARNPTPDPLVALEIEKRQIEIEKARNPQPGYRQVRGADLGMTGPEADRMFNVSPEGQVTAIGGSGTTVNVDTGGGKQFEEAFAKGDAATIETVYNSGLQASRNIGRINQLETLLSSVPTGAVGALKQVAGEFGINTADLDDIQSAQAIINSLVPEQRQPGSGPMSDADLALFKQSLPRIINQPGGNKTIVDTMRAIAQYDAEGAAIVQKLRAGEIDRAAAFRMLQERKNPLESFRGGAVAPTAGSGGVSDDDLKYLEGN